MENLTIKANGSTQPAVYQPKLNFKFYRQTRDDKELKGNAPDGFSALVDGLMDENVDAIVATYYHALAWYKRNQPSEDAVEEALASTIFASDEATDKAFKDIIEEMKQDGFLARRLRQYVKEQDRNADMVQKQIDGTEDPNKRQQLVIGLEEMTEQTNRLKDLLALNESSPKPEDADSIQQN